MDEWYKWQESLELCGQQNDNDNDVRVYIYIYIYIYIYNII